MHRTLLAISLTFFLAAHNLNAQTGFLPLLSHGKNQFALSVSGGLSAVAAGADRIQLYSAVARPTIGIAGRFDVFAQAGVLRQKLQPADGQETEFDSRAALLLGGGLAWRMPVRLPQNFSLYSGAYFSLFQPSGGLIENITNQNTTFRRIRQTTYKWTEAGGALYLVRRLARWELYAGADLQYRWVDIETSVQIEQDQTVVPVNRSKDVYARQLSMSPAFGFNLLLPHSHQFGIHVRTAGLHSFAILIGLSQTGKLD